MKNRAQTLRKYTEIGRAQTFSNTGQLVEAQTDHRLHSRVHFTSNLKYCLIA